MKKVILLFLIVFHFSCIYSQVDSVWNKDEVISQKIKQINPVTIYSEIVTIHLPNFVKIKNFNDPTEELKKMEALYIKDNGTNSFATISLRGGSAGQTDVMWNGISIQNSMLGLSDVSLLKPIFFNQLFLQKNGNISANASSISGSLHISNTFDFTSIAEAQIKLASRNEKEFIAKLNYPIGKIYAQTNLFIEQGDHDFYFENSETTQKGLFQKFYLKKENHAFELNIWYQDALRNIPPVLGAKTSVAQQYDENLRVMASINSLRHSLQLYSSKTTLNFKDESAQIQDTSIVYDQKLNYKWLFEKLKYTIISRSNLNFQNTNVTNYNEKHSNFFAIQTFSFDSKSYDKLPQLSFAGDIHYNRNWAWGGFLAVDKKSKIRKYLLNQKLSIQKGVRFPSLNDLFWNELGNPDLQPERSLSLEYNFQGVRIFNSYISQKNQPQLNINFYLKNTENWIQWLPQNGIWKPQNIKSVQSKGMEIEFKAFNKNKRISTKKLLIETNIDYAYNLTTDRTEKTSSLFNKQLIYTPKHHIVFTQSLSMENWSFQCDGRYTSKAFITSDNSSYLPAYTLWNTNISKGFYINNNLCTLIFQVNNIFNQYYETIALRPMPYRNFELKFNLKINN